MKRAKLILTAYSENLLSANLDSNGDNYSFSGTTLTKNNVKISINIEFSSDSKHIIYDDANGYMHVFDINNNSTEDVSELKYVNNMTNFILTKSGKYVVCRGSYFWPEYKDLKELLISNGTGYSIIVSTGFSIDSFCLSPDENILAFHSQGCDANGFRNHYITLVSTYGSFVDRFDVLNSISNFKWLTNNKLLFEENDKVVTIDTNSREKQTLTNNATPRISVYDAQGNKVIFLEQSGETIFKDGYSRVQNAYKIYAMSTDGTNKVLLVDKSSAQILGETFLLSPDGSKMIYTTIENVSGFHNTLFIINTDGIGGPVKIDEENYGYYYLYWNKAKKILSTNKKFINYENYETTNISFPGISNIKKLIFSEDGNFIAFSSTGNPYTLCVAPVDLSTYTVILSTWYPINPVQWRGNKILIETDNLYIIEKNGLNTNIIGDYACGIVYYPEKLCPGRLNSNGSKVVYMNKYFYGYFSNTDGTGKVGLGENTFLIARWLSDDHIVYPYSSSAIRPYTKLYMADSNGLNAIDFNPKIKHYCPGVEVIENNKIIYMGDKDIWLGTYDVPVSTIPDVIISTPTANPVVTVPPLAANEIKIVVPEDAGYKGTYNPNSGKPITIGFKGDENGGEYTLRIFNLSGELVYSETKSVLTWENWFEWLPDNIASGVYVVYVKGPGVNMNKKIVIMK
ncbi:MAG: hypothetical protein A2252_05750 [Elusimicrobia bacterium RIFOXYA2_FULL_39_19]|nr:MAG: hypothetical protein A2252_05750 [Elusimicrobia bacterium RIFOXYA2_FULL_39_19]